jgi:nitrate/nitrite transport system permease protein
MVSAVFHSPLDAAAQARADRDTEAARAGAAGAPAAATVPVAPTAPVRRPAFDWRELWLRVLPPVIGFAVLVGVWALLTQGGKGFPTPWSTFEAAAKLFADPFYRNGPNDQGIGWNVLFSLERVALGFGLAALVGIPLGFVIGRFDVLNRMVAADQPAAAGVAAGLAADRPAGVQERQPGGDLDHLHLLDLADGDQHRGGRAARAGTTT